MNQLATHTSGKVYYPSESQQVMTELIGDERYVTTQKSNTISQELIDWKYILILSILFFTIEWFVRKYIGKI